MKKTYFLSDAHLGALDAASHEKERMLVRFLDSIKADAKAVYFLGDMFDFWHEYKYVVPKGYTRFLGKLSDLADSGVEVHFFTGNHDIWEYGYLEQECGAIVHHAPELVELGGKTFFLAHGDGLGDPDKKFRFIKSVFTSKVCQWLFRNIMPTGIGMPFGLAWASDSRRKHKEGNEVRYLGENKEHLVLFSKDYIKNNPAPDYFIFGHRHIELDLMLTRNCRMMIVGDWISLFTYVVFDGENLTMLNYEG